LRDGIVPLMEFYPDSDRVRPEFIQSCVEINSGRCESVAELRDNLIETARGVLDRCTDLEMSICGAGTHPFSRRLALITPSPRYLAIEQQRGHMAHTQIVYATHVHIGMKSGEQAATALRRLIPSLPLLVALGANSPYWRSYDTGHASYRQRLLAVTPNSGVPPFLESWAEFQRLYATALRAGIVSSVRDIHWSARFHPDFGTIEIRNPDAQPTIAHAVALAGVIQSLAAYCADTEQADLDPRLPAALPHWLVRENSFRAAQRGLDAQFIVDARGATRPMREILGDVLDLLGPTARGLGAVFCLDTLRISSEDGLPYERQRRDYQTEPSCHYVTERLADWFRNSLMRACPARERLSAATRPDGPGYFGKS
jgi:carboxylate-amine ligase